MKKKLSDMSLDKKFDVIVKSIDDLAVITKKGFDAVDERFKEVDKRFDEMDQRFDKLEFLVSGHDRRLDILEDKVRMISTKIGFAYESNK